MGLLVLLTACRLAMAGDFAGANARVQDARLACSNTLSKACEPYWAEAQAVAETFGQWAVGRSVAGRDGDHDDLRHGCTEQAERHDPLAHGFRGGRRTRGLLDHDPVRSRRTPLRGREALASLLVTHKMYVW